MYTKLTISSITDGYCNNRIMKFSKDGKFITQWGHSSHYSKEGSFGMGYFSLPHDISLDEQTHQVYVADRENGRVQVFNEQGDPIYMIQNPRLYRTVYSAHFSNVHGLFFYTWCSTTTTKKKLMFMLYRINSIKFNIHFGQQLLLFTSTYCSLEWQSNFCW